MVSMCTAAAGVGMTVAKVPGIGKRIAVWVKWTSSIEGYTKFLDSGSADDCRGGLIGGTDIIKTAVAGIFVATVPRAAATAAANYWNNQ